MLHTRQMYKLVKAAYNGLSFPVPDHVWTGGEIRQSWTFNHPYTVAGSGDSVTITGRNGDMQEWVLAS